MVKATRRVKRVKRSKKQVHHGRRKTNRRHKTNRRRYTRRQRGGRIITVCEKTHTGFFKTESNASGIDIMYDDETHMFKIGSAHYETVESLRSFKGAARYERAVSVLNRMGETSTQLNWYNFARFANMYCPNAADPQCAQITAFVDSHRSSRIEDKNPTVVGRIIQDSIKYGQNDNKHSDASFKNSLGSSGASGAAAPDDTDSRKILLNEQGVKFRGFIHKWMGEVCEIDHDAEPFTKYVFTMNKTSSPPSVSIKYVMSSNAKTFCALAKYQMEGSRVYDFKIDFSLFSPSLTLTLHAKDANPWDITSEFDLVPTTISRFYDSCEQPYTDSYEFYEEKNPVIATLFFTKKPETVYDSIVYKNHIQKLINSCVDQLQDPNINKLFTKVEATTIVAKLEEFKERLETSSDQDMNALKQLDKDVFQYVQLTFKKFLGQKTKEQSLVSKIRKMSIGTAGAGAAAAP